MREGSGPPDRSALVRPKRIRTQCRYRSAQSSIEIDCATRTPVGVELAFDLDAMAGHRGRGRAIEEGARRPADRDGPIAWRRCCNGSACATAWSTSVATSASSDRAPAGSHSHPTACLRCRADPARDPRSLHADDAADRETVRLAPDRGSLLQDEVGGPDHSFGQLGKALRRIQFVGNGHGEFE